MCLGEMLEIAGLKARDAGFQFHWVLVNFHNIGFDHLAQFRLNFSRQKALMYLVLLFNWS
jgi:hypothetical protein